MADNYSLTRQIIRRINHSSANGTSAQRAGNHDEQAIRI